MYNTKTRKVNFFFCFLKVFFAPFAQPRPPGIGSVSADKSLSPNAM